MKKMVISFLLSFVMLWKLSQKEKDKFSNIKLKSNTCVTVFSQSLNLVY